MFYKQISLFQVVNGYFVHFIAPKGLEPMPKNIIFILDLSSSMYGDKIRQLKEAMLIILGDLREGDHFNIVTFNSVARVWKQTLLSVTKKNIDAAKTFIRNMRPGGCKKPFLFSHSCVQVFDLSEPKHINYMLAD